MELRSKRKLNRLDGFDYSQDAYYYVTICTENKENHFGIIKDEKMILNEYGKIAEKFWLEIPEHNPNIKLDEFVIMPNHIHGIIIIEKQQLPIVGTEQRSVQNTPNPLGTEQRSVQNKTQHSVGTEHCSVQNKTQHPLGTEQRSVQNTPNPVGTEQRSVQNIPTLVGTEQRSVQDIPTLVGTEHCSVQNKTQHSVGTEQRSVQDIQKKGMSILSQTIKSYKEICTKTIRREFDNTSFGWQRSFYDRIIRDEKELNYIRHYIKNNPLKWELDY